MHGPENFVLLMSVDQVVPEVRQAELARPHGAYLEMDALLSDREHSVCSALLSECTV